MGNRIIKGISPMRVRMPVEDEWAKKMGVAQSVKYHRFINHSKIIFAPEFAIGQDALKESYAIDSGDTFDLEVHLKFLPGKISEIRSHYFENPKGKNILPNIPFVYIKEGKFDAGNPLGNNSPNKMSYFARFFWGNEEIQKRYFYLFVDESTCLFLNEERKKDGKLGRLLTIVGVDLVID